MRGPVFIESLIVGLTGGLIYGIFIYMINHGHAISISVIQTIVLALAFAGLVSIWLWLYYFLDDGQYGRASIGFVGMILFSGPYIYFLVYGVLPYLGQPVHVSTMPFDPSQFVTRVLSALAISSLYTGLYFLPVMAYRHRAQRRQDRIRLAELKARLSARSAHRMLSSHFLHNLILSVGRFAAQRRRVNTTKAINCLIELIQYVLANEQEEKSHVDWRREWEQVQHLVTLSILTKNSPVIHLQEPQGKIMGMVTPLSWLTILENALIHGDYDAGRPITIKLTQVSGELTFQCSNAYTAASRRTGGQGLGLHELAKRGQMEVKDTGSQYTLIFRTGKIGKP